MEFLPSVTSKRTRRLSLRSTLPSFTRPPSRMRVPAAICFSATSVGELKKTIESLSAPSTSATATASTERAEPIRASRRCLRVIATFLLAFEAQSFDQLVDPPQLVGVTGKRTARLANRRQCLVALTQYHIGAHQAQPPLEIRAVLVQPVSEPCDHGSDHRHLLFRPEFRCRRDVLLARSRTAGHARDLLANEIGPGRVGRRRRHHSA